jgi:hypothetical protein
MYNNSGWNISYKEKFFEIGRCMRKGIKTGNEHEVKWIKLTQDINQFRTFVVTAEFSCFMITQLLDVAEHFLRKYSLLRYSRNVKRFIELKVYIVITTARHWPLFWTSSNQPTRFNPLQIHFNCIFPSMFRSSEKLFTSNSHKNVLYMFILYHVWYTPCPLHPLSFNNFKNIIKLLSLHFSP